ncbi:hypothetical protein P43SY_002980 [Pythium insidiosum]|uniref:ACB domain-containing protein n=1 Tax=Pythium insidiosum TaxID=114742 RepID=A0AAD5LEP0_PYTIN|nr:hypothetical protein P43SY_002980 [Pythium insidiosum]
MPTLTPSASQRSVAPSLAPPTGSFLGSLVSNASTVDRARSRFLSLAPRPPDALSFSTAALARDAVGELEVAFAAAVYFVESYQGPHRILKQDSSAPRVEFHALYQQATVGPCPPTAAPADPRDKLEAARLDKWRGLGDMARQEAMQRYTALLDNLVDDWRRSAGLPSPTAATSSGAASPVRRPPPVKKSVSMFERLPRIYDEFGELQERVEAESRKREELEEQLIASTREQRELVAREVQRTQQLRTDVLALVRSLEEDVAQHHNELQLALQREQQLQSAVHGSALLLVERRLQLVAATVRRWLQRPMLRGVVAVLVVLRAWRFLRQRRLPQVVAHWLIRWIATASSLEAGDPRRLPANAPAAL